MSVRAIHSFITCWGLSLWLCFPGVASADNKAKSPSFEEKFRFASQQEAQQLLTAPDEWFSTVGPAQLASLHIDPAGLSSPDQIRPLFAQIAMACDAGQQQRWTNAFAQVWQRMQTLQLHWPEQVVLICSSGVDAPASPYTRQNFIVLPKDAPNESASVDLQLAAHELFHVFSRRKGQVMDAVYRVFNFAPIQPLQWPEEWKLFRISNPDAPDHRHAIVLKTQGVSKKYVPLLVARKIPDGKRETFFDVLDVRLVPIAEGKTSSVVERTNGEIKWIRHALKSLFWGHRWEHQLPVPSRGAGC